MFRKATQVLFYGSAIKLDQFPDLLMLYGKKPLTHLVPDRLGSDPHDLGDLVNRE